MTVNKTSLLVALISVVLLFSCQSRPADRPPKTTTVDLDALYSLPSIIGTVPGKPVWSADGQHLVFLWNDQGFTFRDVWHYSLSQQSQQRLTHHGTSEHEDQSDFGLTGGPTGINEVVWLDATNLQIAYVLDGQLYIKSGQSEPTKVASELRGIRNLTVSPNQQNLAFVTSAGLYLLSLSDNHSLRQLVSTEHPKVRIQSMAWSQDSNQLVFQQSDTSQMPEREIHYDAQGELKIDRVTRAFPGQNTALYTLGMVDLKTTQTRYFERADDSHYIWDYSLSADGESLFINSSDLLIKHHQVLMYDVASGERTVFYQEHDPKHLRPDWQVAWAPQDDGLIILTDKDGYLHLYHQTHAQQVPVALTSGNWEIASFQVDYHNHQLYFLANKSHLAERQIYRVPLAGGEITRVSSATAGTHDFTLSPDAAHLTTLFSNDSTPLELHLIDANSLTSTAITNSPQPAFGQIPWAQISYITFDNHLDGTPLVGRLSLPADYDAKKTYPLIVGSVYSDSVRNQFGGRTSHPTWGLDQYLTSQGYILLNVNVRGSWGQGRKHNQGQRFGYGVVDIEDLHSGVKHLISEGLVDPDRVGIWGSSYGGLMTTMSLFKKPGVYAAGIAGAPATNVAHAYPGQMWVMGEPSGDDQPQRYQNQSPLYHTAGLEDPLMIIHGSKDPVVLYADTIALIEKLIAQQKMFELVTLPGTSHGWDNEGNDVRLFAFKKMVEFFDRHLK